MTNPTLRFQYGIPTVSNVPDGMIVEGLSKDHGNEFYLLLRPDRWMPNTSNRQQVQFYQGPAYSLTPHRVVSYVDWRDGGTTEVDFSGSDGVMYTVTYAVEGSTRFRNQIELTNPGNASHRASLERLI